MRLTFDAYGLSDIGKRFQNEDFLSLLPEHNFFALADGMGGHNAGEIAAQEAMNAINHSVQEFLSPPTSSNLSSEEIARHIKNAIMQAGNHIFFLSQKDLELKGMGTTFSCLYLHNGQATYAHIGDSRIYRLRNAKLKLLTSDHSLISNFKLPADKVPSNYKKMITKALGCSLNVEPTLAQEPFEKGDTFLLCSDGLSDYTEDLEIEKILIDSPSSQKSTERLIETAKKKGSRDNISVIVLKIKADDLPR